VGAVATRAGLVAVAARAGLGATATRVRATRVAAGSLLITAATILTAAVTPPAAAAGQWQRPVAGPLTRAFDYGDDPFAPGRHRGVDFAVHPGDPVRSACAGRVVFAGAAGSSGPTVSVRCGHWRVAYLPLRTLAVQTGARVARGARLGTAARSGLHAGLHVGVRREGRRWAYVDPTPFFGARAPMPVPIGPPPRAVRTPSNPRPAPVRRAPIAAPRSDPVRVPVTAPRSDPVRVPVTAPRSDPVRVPLVAPRGRPVAIPGRRPVPSPSRVPEASGPTAPAPERSLAPWPAWAGLALVLGGASGAGISLRRRRFRTALAVPGPRAAVVTPAEADGLGRST
jgi:hypothetical protein